MYGVYPYSIYFEQGVAACCTSFWLYFTGIILRKAKKQRAMMLVYILGLYIKLIMGFLVLAFVHYQYYFINDMSVWRLGKYGEKDRILYAHCIEFVEFYY